MDSHPPSPTSQPSSPRSDTSSHQYSEVATEPLPPSELRMFNEHMTRRKHFLSDYERYNPIQNMQALANHVFDLSENVHRVGDEVAVSRRMLDMVGSHQREGNHNLRIIGEDVIGLERRFTGLETKFTGLETNIGTAFLAWIFGCIYTTAISLSYLFRRYTKGFGKDFLLSHNITIESRTYVQYLLIYLSLAFAWLRCFSDFSVCFFVFLSTCFPRSLYIHSLVTRDRCWKWFWRERSGGWTAAPLGWVV
ncbi:hypothetical protein L873DRAFT_1829843 [Choiromyces venosus 120613-1]|uniref:Uncharacterized protein n=1 Tax=Choiromyces venosus 120613-1 TaxID=1336337 RepID=A0A3N4JEI8_9PEZI|nr:hypothetical protein L873DRAFT_1829843 [Choiromyces venosus 120613-1]